MSAGAAKGRRWARLCAAVKARPDGWVCGICGEDIPKQAKWPDPRAWTCDHITPHTLAPELKFEYTNLQPAHYRCNNQKGDRTSAPERRTPTRHFRAEGPL